MPTMVEKIPEEINTSTDTTTATRDNAGLERAARADPSQDYPEGGLEGWLCVLGSFLALFGSLGLLNSIGTFQAYVDTHQLASLGPGKTGWIFSLFTFLTFFCGVHIGPVFDAKGPRLLVTVGTILVLTMLLTLGSCTQYWQFILSFSMAGGIGVSMIFSPAVAAVGHFFFERRGMATGIAAAGGSLGGVVFPLLLSPLFEQIGFAWASREVALICLVCLIAAICLLRSRFKTDTASVASIRPDLTIFKEPKLLLTTLSIFFIEWGLFVPLTYITSYALDHGIGSRLSFQLLALLNVGSVFGRLLPGYLADRWGRFNTLILTILLCLLCTSCLWQPAGANKDMLIAFCLLFGFASGSNISLTPVCIGQLCETKDYGRYYATSYTIVSFSALTGVPIAGSILSICDGDYWALIVFTSCCYAAGLATAISVKILAVGWRHPLKFY